MSKELPPQSGAEDSIEAPNEGETERLKRLLADERRQRRDLLVAEASKNAIAEAIREAVPTRPTVPTGKYKVRRPLDRKYEGLVHISDVHYGEQVRASSTGGLAEYSPEIAKARVLEATEQAIDIGRYMKIGKLAVLWGGDMMSGTIHDDLERSNVEMIVQQTLDMADITAVALEQFAQAFPQIDVDGRSGNHGRPYRPMFFNRKQVENWDYVLYQFQEKMLANQKNIKFLTSESFWNIVEVGNRKFLTMHGDTIKHQNSMSLPWYSRFKELMKWQGMRGRGGPDFDDMLIGHFHNDASIRMGDSTLRVAPAVKGPDDYSYAGSRLPVPAGARFLTVAEGEVKSDHIIKLS